MIKKWARKGSRLIYDNQWIRVIEYDVVRPDNTKGIYAVIETKAQAVTIVAIAEDKRVCLINEYRFPLNRTLWRLPMGGAGQDHRGSLESAQAELLEETGLIAAVWKMAGQTVTMSGLSPEVAHIYIATELSPLSAGTNDYDIQDVRFFSIDDLSNMIRGAQLIDGQSLSALTISFASLGFGFPGSPRENRPSNER
jgi:8-oxo-dGTP pyrophosphatase MutT (NUDIX family)